MSERAFHMTPAQAKLLHEAATDGLYVNSNLSGPESNAFRALQRKKWVKHSGWPFVHIATYEGREALQRYEEGRA